MSSTFHFSEIIHAVFRLLINNDLQPLNASAKLIAKKIATKTIDPDLANRVRGRRPLKPERPVEWIINNKLAYDLFALVQGEEPVLLVLDASTRRQIETNLIQNSKTQAIGRLAGGIAHDFNNLLTAIIGHSNSALENIELSAIPIPKSIKTDLESIYNYSIRSGSMVRQLLAFAREQDLTPELIYIQDRLHDIWTLLDQLAGEMVQLECQIDPKTSPIRMDGSQLEQIFINLVVNARDAMPFGGSIIFEVQNEIINNYRKNRGEVILPGKYTRIRVIDSGSGIDCQTMERIFDPYYTTKGVGQGTGLGLAMIDGIMRQSGGFVTVENSAQSLKGAQFDLLFPSLRYSSSIRKNLQQANKTKQTNKQDSKEKNQDLNYAYTVLLVEDEESVRKILAHTLKHGAAKVIAVANGDFALDVIEDINIDVLVTDLIMPGITGNKLIVKIRQEIGEIPTLCISGYADHELFADIHEMENVKIITKPFDMKTIRKEVLTMAKKQYIRKKH